MDTPPLKEGGGVFIYNQEFSPTQSKVVEMSGKIEIMGAVCFAVFSD